MVVLLVWQQLASVSSVVAVMAQLVVVVASSPFVEEKCSSCPLHWHAIHLRTETKCCYFVILGEWKERNQGVGRDRKAGDVLTRKLVRIK